MNSTVRKIFMIVAAAVFLFSSVMVLYYYSQMRAGAELVETMAEMAVVIPTEDLRKANVVNTIRLRTEPNANKQGFETYKYIVKL